MSNALPPLLVLLGPTASGKTAAAIALARKTSIEVIAADSRQLRRGMHIGTAAPSEADLMLVPHHLVGIVEADAPWTLADWPGGHCSGRPRRLEVPKRLEPRTRLLLQVYIRCAQLFPNVRRSVQRLSGTRDV